MSVRERIVDGDTRFGFMRIRSGDYDLIVETRELYSTYRIVRMVGRGRNGWWYESQEPILYHSVRTPEPVPIRPAHIIHARRIPWFLWIYYGVRDWRRKRLSDREMAEWAEKDQARREAIRKAVKERGFGRFGGRYNR